MTSWYKDVHKENKKTKEQIHVSSVKSKPMPPSTEKYRFHCAASTQRHWAISEETMCKLYSLQAQLSSKTEVVELNGIFSTVFDPSNST